MVQYKSIIFIAVIGLAVLLSGCTGGQDVISVVKALPEVQQFMNEHPNAKITVTYWSKEEVSNLSQEISQQCDKPITPVAMYKATVSEGDLKIISWINAENQIIICSTTQGNSSSQITIPTSTPTPVYTPLTTLTLKEPPQASLRLAGVNLINDSVTIEHQGGDDIQLSDIELTVEFKDSAGIISRVIQGKMDTGINKFTPGDKLLLLSNTGLLDPLNGAELNPSTPNILAPDNSTATGAITLAAGGRVTVSLIDVPTGQMIMQATINT
jgi:FlaG/FlaF family flagellin (archaellin)